MADNAILGTVLAMSDAEYPELKVVEASAPCPVLARLPRLPVAVLVLVQEGFTGEGRPLADRLVRLAEDLAVGDGVSVTAHSFVDWPSMLADAPVGRFDVVFLHTLRLPADPDDASLTRGDVVDGLFRLLGNVEARFQVVAPEGGARESGGVDRRPDLLLALLRRGAPPAIQIPKEWPVEEVARFELELLERILHDAPLVQAAATATGDRSPLPTVYQPPGRRHGLDLGRLLEDHRRRIEEGGSALRMLLREVEAFRPPPEERPPDAAWQEISRDMSAGQEALEAIKEAVEEINRDRDPAGWSRLADSIAGLKEWEAQIQEYRRRLDGFREAAYGAAPRG